MEEEQNTATVEEEQNTATVGFVLPSLQEIDAHGECMVTTHSMKKVLVTLHMPW